MREIGLEQPHAADRLALCRLVTAAAVVRTVWHMPPGEFFTEHSDLLDRARGRPERRAMPAGVYEGLRVTAVLSTTAWALGVDHPAVKLCANVSFGVLQKRVVDFHPELWTYNSHLNAFLALLSVTEARAAEDDEFASTTLAALQSSFACVYLQSGLAKLIGSGPSWLRGGTTRAAWGELGTPLGKRLATSDPWIAALASAGTVAFEFGFAPALVLAWRRRALAGLASVLFHGTVKATMDISFWHLAWFAGPLFSVPDSVTAGIARHLRSTTRRSRRRAWAVAAGAALSLATRSIKWRKVVARAGH
ncbi:hypothetical protein ALI22I_09600 [Saccharothrix sp. ALI-22-I]|nr:hypothetical protein ALI22I_09600 [Saccharothrix sp. ALI-22-I]